MCEILNVVIEIADVIWLENTRLTECGNSLVDMFHQTDHVQGLQ